MTVLCVVSCASEPVATGVAGEYCRDMKKLWGLAEENAEDASEIVNRRVDDTSLYMDEEWRTQATTTLRKRRDAVEEMAKLTPPLGGEKLQDKAWAYARAEDAFILAVRLSLGSPPNFLSQTRIERRLWNLKDPTDEFEAEFREYCGWDISP